MATKLEEILGKDINSLKELREEIKRLQDSIAAADTDTQEFADTSDKLRAAQDQLKAVTKGLTDENKAATDSIAGMEKAYKELYNEYKLMDEAARKGEAGIAKAARLKELSEDINKAKMDVGNFKDNIGRYSDSIIDAFKQMGGSLGALEGPLKAATKGQQAMNTAMKANPIGAVIVLIQGLIAIYNKMKSAVKENEDLQMRWNEAMAVFQPLVDKIKNGIDKLATSFVQFMEAVANAYGKIKEFFAGVTDFLGITKDAKKNVQETNAAYRELAKAQSELTKQTREYKKLNAKDQAEVERLREEASDTDNLVEKRKLLNEAKEKQAVIDQRNIEIAEENLRILKEEAARAANDAAANEKLADAEAAVDAARATAAKNQRQYNRELKAGSTATKNYREEAKKLYEDTLEYSKTEVQKLTEKYEKEKKLLEKYHYDTTELTKKYNKDLQKLQDEAAKTAREKANAAIAYAKAVNDETARLFNNMNGNQSALAGNIMALSAETIAFQKLHKAISGVTEEDLTEWAKAIEPMIETFNAEFEESINFPPELTPETKAKFFQSMENFLKELKERLGTANADFAEEYLNGLSNGFIQEGIENLENGGTGFNKLIEQQNRYLLQQQADTYYGLLSGETLTAEKRLEIQQKYYEALQGLREKDLYAQELNKEKTIQIFYDAMGVLNSVNQSVNAISSSYEQLINSEVQSGKITQEQADKKMKAIEALEKLMLGLTITQIAADTAGGIQSVWKAWAMEKVANAQTAAATGPAAAATLAALNAKSLTTAILQTTALATNGAAQIAAATMGTISKLNAMKESGADGGASVVASPSEINSTPYSYSRTLQTQDEIDELNSRPVWVSVEDISSALGHQVKVTDESSF